VESRTFFKGNVLSTKQAVKPLVASILVINTQIASAMAEDCANPIIADANVGDTAQTTTLNEAISIARNCNNNGNDVNIQIADTLAGQTIEFNNESAISIDGNKKYVITGPAENRVTIKDSHVSNALFRVQESSELELNNLIFSGEDLSNRTATLIELTGSNPNPAPAAGGSSLTINNSRFENITSQYNFGGVVRVTGGALTITDSVFKGNNNQANEGSRGGAIHFQTDEYGSSDLNISNSLFDGNRSEEGGAIFAYPYNSTIKISNTTLANNYGNTGGALYLQSNSGGDVDILHSTFVNNQSFNGTNRGAAIHVESAYHDVVISHTAFSGNSSGRTICMVESGTPTLEYSYLDDSVNNSCNNLTDGGGNILPVNDSIADVKLGDLSDNGGKTQSYAPAGDSPLINSGNPQIANAPATDQRGETRVARGQVDIGSVEFQGTAPTTSVTIENQTIKTSDEISIDADIFNDAEGDSYTFAMSGAPSGLAIDENSGEISGKATETGEFTIVVTVTDQWGLSSITSMTLTVEKSKSKSSSGGTLWYLLLAAPFVLRRKSKK